MFDAFALLLTSHAPIAMRARQTIGWTSPPTRREITVLLLCIGVFLLAYNLETSLRALGFDLVSKQSSLLNRIGLGVSEAIDEDGRRPVGWRDKLEDEIVGEWKWEPGHAAGDGAERSHLVPDKLHGAMWLGIAGTGTVSGGIFGDTTADDNMFPWGDEPPQSKIVQQVPGFTVVDNLVIFNGSTYLIFEDLSAAPPISSIFLPDRRSWPTEWEIISTAEARDMMPDYGAFIRGPSFLSTDSDPHNSTLISLWRTYSSLDTSIDSEGRTILPTPRRLIFTSTYHFSDPSPTYGYETHRRPRSETGHHPYTPKAAFPTMIMGFLSDWLDYHQLHVPFVLERAVIASRVAAAPNVEANQPVFSAPFQELEASKFWWEPIRRTFAEYLGVYETEGKKSKPVVTYIENQGAVGARIRDQDHEELVKLLNKMGYDYGYEIHVVSEDSWVNRMTAIAKSTVVLGVHGRHLYDSVFMKPSPQSTLMEIFPGGLFRREQEVLARSLGIRYIAWWNEQKFSGDSLPAVTAEVRSLDVPLDAKAIVKAIHEELSRKS